MMRRELASLPVDFYGVNDITAVANQSELTSRAAFPFFQDQPDVGVWQIQGGHKDDLFIYDRTGRLFIHFPAGGAVSTDLSTEIGYSNVRAAILQAAAR